MRLPGRNLTSHASKGRPVPGDGYEHPSVVWRRRVSGRSALAGRKTVVLRHARSANHDSGSCRELGSHRDGAEPTVGALGWLPDGRLLVVSMQDRRVLRMEPTGLVEHADMSGFAAHECKRYGG